VPIPGPGAYFQIIYDEGFLMIDNLHIYLQEKGLKEPMDQRYSPYAWKSGQEGKIIWDIMAQHPERFAAFQAGLAHASATVPLTGYYDFSKLKTEGDRPVLVDLGGGAGHAILRILEAYPDLPAKKFVLQDLKPVLDESKRTKTLPDDVTLMEHDFYTPQPVQGVLFCARALTKLTLCARCEGVHVPTRHARLLRSSLYRHSQTNRARDGNGLRRPARRLLLSQ
jgi:O-methyltransferase domain